MMSQNQGHCGSCWAFSTTGSTEGVYFLATGALRSLSEQQLVDCAGGKFGNKGCQGGIMEKGYQYIIANKGIDSEKEYTYNASNGACWTAAEKRHVATIDSFVDVAHKDEAQLQAAVMKNPVSIAIEADKPYFQHYKSGTLDNVTACGTKLDHGDNARRGGAGWGRGGGAGAGEAPIRLSVLSLLLSLPGRVCLSVCPLVATGVLIVGMTADAYIVKVCLSVPPPPFPPRTPPR
jgi:hypothetical protein